MIHSDAFSLCLHVRWLTIGASRTLYKCYGFWLADPLIHHLAAVWSLTDLQYCEVITHLSAWSSYYSGLYVQYL